MSAKPSFKSPSPSATSRPARAAATPATSSSARTRNTSSLNPLNTRSPLPQLRAFLIHLATERGLAENTIWAYRRDLEDLDDFFRDAGLSILTAEPDEFRRYLREESRAGQSTKTVARRL